MCSGQTVKEHWILGRRLKKYTVNTWHDINIILILLYKELFRVDNLTRKPEIRRIPDLTGADMGEDFDLRVQPASDPTRSFAVWVQVFVSIGR